MEWISLIIKEMSGSGPLPPRKRERNGRALRPRSSGSIEIEWNNFMKWSEMKLWNEIEMLKRIASRRLISQFPSFKEKWLFFSFVNCEIDGLKDIITVLSYIGWPVLNNKISGMKVSEWSLFLFEQWAGYGRPLSLSSNLFFSLWEWEKKFDLIERREMRQLNGMKRVLVACLICGLWAGPPANAPQRKANGNKQHSQFQFNERIKKVNGINFINLNDFCWWVKEWMNQTKGMDWWMLMEWGPKR